MSQALTTSEEGRIARPLRVLVPLIQADLTQGKEAGMPYYQAAGEKLREARPQHDSYASFGEWVRRNFNIGQDTAAVYMKYAEAVETKNSSAPEFSSLSNFMRNTDRPSYNRPAPSWREPVEKIINRIDTETLNLKREELKRADDREAQRELALQLIDIGYKVLARTLHPDKGGSREAMARLNMVRDRLKQHV